MLINFGCIYILFLYNLPYEKQGYPPAFLSIALHIMIPGRKKAVAALLHIPLRIILLPSPGILTHLPDPSLGHPAQLRLSLGRVRVALGHVPGPPLLEHVVDL